MTETSVALGNVEPFARAVQSNVGRVIVGKDAIIEKLLVALLCGGHVLLEDVPGVGKTMLARAMAQSLGLRFRRLQCTPDLLPNDVTGVSVYRQNQGEFEFQPGPVFANILLADELNRATPRTQSSLLEAMGESQVTVDGVTHSLPQPFLVIATQNPVEFEGTFPLPEAQLDRFLLRITLGYPTAEEELRILEALEAEHPIHSLQQVVTGEDLPQLQKEVWQVHVSPELRNYIVQLVEATRKHSDLALGSSPRGTLALFRTSQALALLRGRSYVIPDDIKELAQPVLGHRLLVRPESSLRGRNATSILAAILEETDVPV